MDLSILQAKVSEQGFNVDMFDPFSYKLVRDWQKAFRRSPDMVSPNLSNMARLAVQLMEEGIMVKEYKIPADLGPH